MRAIWAFVVCLAILCLSTPTPVFASDVEPEGYRTAVDEALREYAAQHYGEARSLFQRANALYPNARTLRGLGMAEFELRNYGLSIRRLEEALQSDVRKLTGELRAQTEQLLTRARGFVAEVVLKTTPRAVSLRIDGNLVAYEPGQVLLLNVGEHRLELRAAGFVPATRSLSARGGERQTLDVPLAPVTTSDTVGDLDVRDDSQQRRGWYRSPWLWAGISVLVVGGAVSAGLLLGGEREPTPRFYGGTAGDVVQAP